MPQNTANMDLRQWNNAGDFFEHVELSSNWTKVDEHDHTANKGVQIPSDGIEDGAITQAKLAPGIADVSHWHPLVDWKGGPSVVAPSNGTYLLTLPTWGSTGASSGNSTAVFYLDPADFALSGKTTQYRVRSFLTTNIIVPGASFTVSLYTASNGAGSSGQPPSWGGTGISGTAVTYTTPSNGTRLTQVTAPFAPPAAGYLAFGVSPSAASAAGSVIDIRAHLQVRWV